MRGDSGFTRLLDGISFKRYDPVPTRSADDMLLRSGRWKAHLPRRGHEKAVWNRAMSDETRVCKTCQQERKFPRYFRAMKLFSQKRLCFYVHYPSECKICVARKRMERYYKNQEYVRKGYGNCGKWERNRQVAEMESAS